MKRFTRWFKTRHGLLTELNTIDRHVREITFEYSRVRYELEDIQGHVEVLCTTLEDFQEKMAAQHLMLSALGAVEASGAQISNE